MAKEVQFRLFGREVFGKRTIENDAELRSSEGMPLSNLKNPESWFRDAFGYQSASSVIVNEDTALTLSAVWSCVRVLSETIAMLPLNVYNISAGSREVAANDPIHYLLHDQPNSFMTSFIFRQTMQMQLVLTGNAYAIIVRDGLGNVIALELIPWSKDVYVTRSTQDGEKYFSYRGKVYANYEIIHLLGISYDGLKGISPLQYARDNMGTGISLQNFGGTFFKNGARLSGAIEVPTKLDDKAYANLKASFSKEYSGSDNVGKTMILEAGSKYVPISLSNEDAQYLLSRKFSIEEVARLYRVPLHMIGSLDKATFNNIEQLGIEFATHTINPYLILWEQELKNKLISVKKRAAIDIRFDMNSIMRGDSAARAAYFKELFYAAAISPNEIRAAEGMNAYDGGDKKYVPVNMVESDLAGANVKTTKETKETI